MIPTLYIVATPIGTLSDFSDHAQAVLQQVDLIVCEDTRHSRKLLERFQVKKHLRSLPGYQEKQKAQALIAELLQLPEAQMALITDAGTPAVSDPGALLVAEAHKQGVRVLNVPGPSSLACALASCGFLAPRSVFSAFIGRTQKEQHQEFRCYQAVAPCIGVFFESPKRLLKTLNSAMAFFDPSLNVCVSREISKQFEEHLVGTIDSVIKQLQSKTEILGEFVVCFEVKDHVPLPEKANIDSIEKAAQMAIECADETQSPLKECCKKIAFEHGFSAKEIYAMAVKKQ